MTTKDLKPFCAKRGCLYSSFEKPWSFGGYTFATDGAILLRVKRLARVKATSTAAEGAMKLFESSVHVAFRKLPKLPPFNRLESESPQSQMKIGKHTVAVHYLRKIKKLPCVRIAEHPTDRLKELAFVFLGGEGRLMPMRVETP